MSYRNSSHTGRAARSMQDINPHMSDELRPMPERRIGELPWFLTTASEVQAYIKANNWIISACNGNCKQGRFCDCAPDVEPVASVEQEWPLLVWLYVVAVVAGILSFLLIGEVA